MKHDHARRTWTVPGLFLALLVGLALGWWLRGGAPIPSTVKARSGPESSTSPPFDASSDGERATSRGAVDDRPRVPVIASPPPPHLSPADAGPPTIASDPVAELRHRHLRLPLAQVNVEALKGSFDEGRDRGARPHEAVDMMAPRNTPIQAVEDGIIAKLFSSKLGGLTIYQFDPRQEYCYYYAHLERYASGLTEGMRVRAGDVLGYVGSSGNASPNAPHLHFAIFRLTPARHWWEGTPIDPYRVFAQHDRTDHD